MRITTSTKPKRNSKTLWVNGLTIVAGCLAVVAGSDLIADYPRIAAGMVTALGTLNYFLRLITKQPLE